MNLRLLLPLLPLLFAACSITRPMTMQFEDSPVPPAPDYSQQGAWIAFPGVKDSSDLMPKGVDPVEVDKGPADVFWVYPTLWYKRSAWNASLQNEALNHDIRTGSIKFQASVFNAAGKIYAPYYRQMAMGGFFTEDTADMHKALNLAYSDVKAAFEYYLAHHNNGRPIIIAGHSQGALHATRLVREYFGGKALHNQLIGAYLIGYPFREKDLAGVPVCTNATQTGCAVGWYTWRKGAVPPGIDGYYKNAVIVNPVTWTCDSLPTDPGLHQGMVLRDFKVSKVGNTQTQLHKTILWCDNPIPGSTIKNYHVGDINIFWMNIRSNSLARTKAWQEQQDENSRRLSRNSVVLPQLKQE